MGNSNSISKGISINLDGDRVSYFGGDTISGTVDLNIVEDTAEAGEIYLSLIGEIGYTTEITKLTSSFLAILSGTGQRYMKTKTNYHNVKIYSSKFIFPQIRSEENEATIRHIQYLWPFQFQLPDHLPPTINESQTYPYVRYYLQLFINKLGYRSNTIEKKYLRIYPHMNLLENSQYLTSKTFEYRNQDIIILKGSLNKSGYVRGETIYITLDIENPRKVFIQNIDISMLHSYQIETNISANTVSDTILSYNFNTNNLSIRKRFSLQIPLNSIPPSYQSKEDIERLASIKVHYFLRIDVKIQGIPTKLFIDIPFTLGTEPHLNLNQLQSFNPSMSLYSLNLEQSIFYDDLPPSYDSIVQNSE